MNAKDLTKAERDSLAAEDALAAALAHGTTEEKQAARERLRKAQRRVNAAAQGSLAGRTR